MDGIWEENTTLIIGDRMLYGLEEEKQKYGYFEDLLLTICITPLLQKRPKNIIFHVGTNNCIKDNLWDSRVGSILNYK